MHLIYTQFRLYGLLIFGLFGDFGLYGFLENVFPNTFFAFMDFSLLWTILAGTIEILRDKLGRLLSMGILPNGCHGGC